MGMAICAFGGHLYNSGMLKIRTLAQILEDLLGGSQPPEHFVASACALLQVVQESLSTDARGRPLLQRFSLRLSELRQCKTPRGGSHLYSADIQVRIGSLRLE